ncbi:Type I restriction-modification system, specificity subunit S (modular protein) [Desulfosarcina cetonica]|uniref:restriction endonuclease subunit S n=1 Tax=Desulfosarcina cetonica TaxID=90730 RepID=UPI0006D29EF4|nr:restriction endonuclease subunit S [Desulfosarcina cetonica]VTR66856.1 Type I restriction-modification system, specificity subunit S (modular protein) [Desulfosarcina cetonica]
MMSTVLKPYPEYRPSGLPWLGTIPSHWEVRRNGRLFAQRNQTGYPDLPILEVSLKTGVRIRDLENAKRKQVMSEREKYKRAVKGEIAYNMMRMWQGAVGVAPADGLISPAYVVARPLEGTDSRYFAYLFRTGAYMSEVNKYSHGIVTDRNRLYWDEFKQMPSPFPPPEEQKAIAEYLDRKDMEIREFIRNKRRLVALLNERKLALVNEAVTRGIDPHVRFKPSGIDWIGEIPAHWEIRPLKHWVRINEKTLPETTDPEFQFNYIDIGSVGTGFLIDPPEKMRFGSSPSRARRILSKNDIILSTVRTYLKAVYFIDNETDSLIASTGFAVLTPPETMVPKFLSFVIQNNRFIERVTAYSTGVNYPAITASCLGSLHVAIPISKEEQRIIANHIEEKIASINTAIQRAEREIELIEEYHTTMICDAVFGRLDVRHLAKPEKRRKPNVHFCRSVLAAEIVDRHRDTPRFGWIKLQKAILLAERHLELEEIQSRPVRAAAGPFDNAMMRSVHAQMKHSKWFEPQRQEGGGIAYLPMEKCGAHRDYFDRYWGDRKTSFDRLMELIHPMKTEQIEIVATLYAAWNDFLIQGETMDDDRLVDEVLNRWDASKKRISEDRWRTAIDWMREKNLVPKGYGRATERSQDGDC